MTNLEQELCKYRCTKIGDEEIIKIGNIDFYIINPKYNMNNENDNSLVIYFTINNKNILYMGDSSSVVEERIINNYKIGKIDILKVGHHGSNTSSSKVFIDEIKPLNSVISVGKNNRYEHPNKETLEILKGSKIYRTDLNGSVLFRIESNKLQIKTFTP